MKKLSPLYLIGTIGMMVTPIVHIVFSLVSKPSHKTFMLLYVIFIAFIAISTGGGKQMRLQKVPVRRK
ncbi:MAG TPA: hypothetical protein VGF30_15310 [Bacteroidia bacterium]